MVLGSQRQAVPDPPASALTASQPRTPPLTTASSAARPSRSLPSSRRTSPLRAAARGAQAAACLARSRATASTPVRPVRPVARSPGRARPPRVGPPPPFRGLSSHNPSSSPVQDPVREVLRLLFRPSVRPPGSPSLPKPPFQIAASPPVSLHVLALTRWDRLGHRLERREVRRGTSCLRCLLYL